MESEQSKRSREPSSNFISAQWPCPVTARVPFGVSARNGWMSTYLLSHPPRHRVLLPFLHFLCGLQLLSFDAQRADAGTREIKKKEEEERKKPNA